MALPPPYTQEQINAMKSDEEKLRARAELTSYIVRMKREKEEREAEEARRNGTTAFGQHPTFTPSGYRGGYRAQYTPRGPGFVGSGNHYVPRGRFTSYRGRYASRGRGNHGFHPYQRAPAHHGSHNHMSQGAEPLQSNGLSNSNSRGSIDTHSKQSDQPQTNPTVCPAFTSTGVCARHKCPHIHDPNKQAVCKLWFYKDSCSKGDFCHLSHQASPNNAPTCTHFQSGSCLKEDCRYAHVHLSPLALNCDVFGRLGFCEKGDQCPEVHVHECPAFANNGTCSRGDSCSLRHVLNASRLRAASRRSPLGSPKDTEEQEEDDTQAALPEVLITGRKDDTQDANSISQQADFVPLE